MTHLRLFALLAFSLTGLLASPAHAQLEDVVYSGNALSILRVGVSLNDPLLETEQLRVDLGAVPGRLPVAPLTVLIVPKEAGPKSPKVYKLFNDKSTNLREQAVAATDIEQLRGHIAKPHVAYLLRTDLVGKPKESAVAGLTTAINSLPKDGQSAARRFAGGVLADQGASDPKLVVLIDEFRKAEEEKIKKSVRPEFMLEGVPYAIGCRPLNDRHLKAIPVDGVGEILIGKDQVKTAWVGSSVVIVRPTREKGGDMSVPVLNRLELDPKQKEKLKLGNDLPPTQIPPPPNYLKK